MKYEALQREEFENNTDMFKTELEIEYTSDGILVLKGRK
jgi:hypothetical protein